MHVRQRPLLVVGANCLAGRAGDNLEPAVHANGDVLTPKREAVRGGPRTRLASTVPQLRHILGPWAAAPPMLRSPTREYLALPRLTDRSCLWLLARHLEEPSAGRPPMLALRVTQASSRDRRQTQRRLPAQGEMELDAPCQTSDLSRPSRQLTNHPYILPGGCAGLQRPRCRNHSSNRSWG